MDKLDLAGLRSIIGPISYWGLHWLYFQGYEWYEQIGMRALRSASKMADAPGDLELVATAWMVVGDLRTCCGGYHSATSAYKKALAADPQCHKAHYELHRSYALIGNHELSREHLKLWQASASYNPLNPRYEQFQEAFQLRDADRYVDCLMYGRLQVMPKSFDGKLINSLPAETLVAQFLGATGQYSQELKAWRATISKSEYMDLPRTVFFFLSHTLWNTRGFWDLLSENSHKFRGITITDPVWPAEPFGPPEIYDLDSWSSHSPPTQVKVIAEFNIARITCDLDLLERLEADYPHWSYPKGVRLFIHNYGRSPLWLEMPFVWSLACGHTVHVDVE